MKKSILIPLIYALFIGLTSSASASSYSPPMIGDRIIHSCVMPGPWFGTENSNRCSKLAQKFIADEFCRLKGYKQSTGFLAAQSDQVRSKVKELNINGQHYWSDGLYFAIFQTINCG